MARAPPRGSEAAFPYDGYTRFPGLAYTLR